MLPIDRLLLEKSVAEMINDKTERGYEVTEHDIYNVIEEQPVLSASDIEPEYARLTHGHWIKLRISQHRYRCSHCKEDVFCNHNDCDFNFCPNCGAIMDEEEQQ